MNENVNLSKILRDCLKGTKLYSPLFGVVKFEEISEDWNFVCVRKGKDIWTFTYDARFLFGISNSKSAEIMLFPSKEQRDWSKFNVPDKIEPKFNVGDWIVFNGFVLYVKKVVNGFYITISKGGIPNSYDWDIDNIARLWTIQDAKDGDVLVNGSNIFIFHFINNRRLMGYCHVNMDDGNFYNDIGRNECFCTIDAPVTPATKEQRDLLFQQITEADYKWNAKTKTLEKLSEPKFDPKTLNLFDKVLVKMSNESFNTWYGDFVAEPSHAKNETPLILGAKEANMVIPYNNETKHLIGTTDEAPEYYRYWEE